MKPNDSLEIRKEMVVMHEEYIGRLNDAMKNDQFVEASWLCYAIFEQRINRLIDKFLYKCPKKQRVNGTSVSISVRIICLEKLIRLDYGGFSTYDVTLLPEIKRWCKTRNELVHGLVSLDHYQNYDEEFKRLAESGQPLVNRLYKENRKFRKWFMETDELAPFPYEGCRNDNQCIKQSLRK
jgi:hypothetical protein